MTNKNIALTPAGPTKLAFTNGPFTGTVGQCLGPINIQTQNASGTATNVTATTTIDLSSNNGSTGAGAFYSASGCSSSLTSRTIAAGSNSTSFFYEATGRGNGTHVLTASDHASVLTSATQLETINKANQATLSVTAPTSGTFGDHLAMSATGGSSTGALSFTVDSGSSACSILTSGPDSGKLAITSGTGSCSITAHKAGDSNYNPVDSASSAVAINKADPQLSIDLSGVSKTFGDTPFSVVTNVSSLSGGTLHFSTGSGSVGCTVTDGGSVTITGAAVGTDFCVISVSQDSTANYTSGGPTNDQFHIAKVVPAAVDRSVRRLEDVRRHAVQRRHQRLQPERRHAALLNRQRQRRLHRHRRRQRHHHRRRGRHRLLRHQRQPGLDRQLHQRRV